MRGENNMGGAPDGMGLEQVREKTEAGGGEEKRGWGAAKDQAFNGTMVRKKMEEIAPRTATSQRR